MELESLYRDYRKPLFAVAYRMLGSASDAEDIVQDVFAGLPAKPDSQAVESWRAYLMKAVTNRCINVLHSSAKKRTEYIGPWLPEPLYDGADADPANSAIRHESVSYAFLVMLEKLTPPERAVFVLREALSYEYADIADILDKTETSCRQLFSRAKRKLPMGESDTLPESTVSSQLADTFMSAVKTGRFDAFVKLLAEDATLVSDGGGKVRAAFRPILGSERIAAFFQGIEGKGALQGTLHKLVVNGQMGLLLLRDGEPVKLMLFAFNSEHHISDVYIILNPEKLIKFTSQIGALDCLD
ncbi:RNA polymerase sigma-70 factor [Paenibacillus thalictri]|uniref:RNA polymerase sigma-70 factor n=1 Tax=Paenibacillus thalictri TaxID=2527873 RepID=A0A4Q9DVF6_9BACL|nr:RNA polymerase sigma-70 factor [Paenibacillus thalictri]TBL79950.1 RNA polymerase sigma-70 factor [Paenibacillus thalictri]